MSAGRRGRLTGRDSDLLRHPHRRPSAQAARQGCLRGSASLAFVAPAAFSASLEAAGGADCATASSVRSHSPCLSEKPRTGT